jgi:hypothetical protein
MAAGQTTDAVRGTPAVVRRGGGLRYALSVMAGRVPVRMAGRVLVRMAGRVLVRMAGRVLVRIRVSGRGRWILPRSSWPGVSRPPPPVGGTAAEAAQPPVRGWPEHTRP